MSAADQTKSRASAPLMLATRARGGKGGAGEVPRNPVPTVNTIQRAILVSLMACCPQAANAYAIVKALRNRDGTSMFTVSSIYRQILRLVDLGLLERDEVVTSRGRLSAYSLTKEGIASIERWTRSPASVPLEVAAEASLLVASVRFSRPRDVLQRLSALADEIDDRLADLEFKVRGARRNGPWGTADDLEYRLDRAGLDAGRQWVREASALLEAKAEALSHAPSGN